MADLSVIITAHSEGVALGATLRSAAIAVAEAQNAGITCELLLGLDCASAETQEVARGLAAARWTKYEVEFGDPFLTRNSLVEASDGDLVALIDGDDLVSANWLSLATKRLATAPAGAVAHPEINVIFDKSNSSFIKIAPDNALFLPELLYFDNYYDLMAISSRDTYLQNPFSPRRIDLGYGYQDWEWAMQTLADGIPHIVVRDTIIFKRRRAGSISQMNRKQAAAVRYIPKAMRIDKVRLLGKNEDRS